MARTCRLDGCSDPVRGRRRYCSPDHAHVAKLASQALNGLQHGEKYNEARRQFRAEGQSAKYDDQQAVVDLTLPGAASRPPNYDVPTWSAAASSARELAGRPFWLSFAFASAAPGWAVDSYARKPGTPTLVR